MPSYFLESDVLAFAALRMLLAAGTLAGLWVLWRRPSASWTLALVVTANVVAWAAYAWPLARSYGLAEGSDRGFNLGMWACVTQGVSPLEHTQRGFGSPEPLWNVLVPLLAGWRLDAVGRAYDLLSPLSLIAVALGVYFGLRPARAASPAPADEAEHDRWERVLMAFAALGLVSLSFAPRAPVPPFWAANFLLKPHHACAFGLIAAIAGQRARAPRRALAAGALLGLLGWAYLMSWGYLVFGLAFGFALLPRGERSLKTLATVLGLSALALVPYVLHLLRDFNPFDAHHASRHMWSDARGLPLAVPTWATLDSGALLALGALGLAVWWRRRTPRDGVLLGVVGGAWLLWLVSLPAALLGVAPEPDELHYFVRFGMALAAGAGLAALARWAARGAGRPVGQASIGALMIALPLAFTSYWDPPNMDRYYANSVRPIPRKVLDYGRWIREHTRPGTLFVAGSAAATWIPVLAGRQVLLAEGGELLPRDVVARKAAERVLLRSQDPAEVRAVAARYGVDYVAIDESLVLEYGAAGSEELAREPLWRTLYISSALRLVELAPR